MDLTKFLPPDVSEKPLDVLKDDGGFTSVFRTVAVIGDSLAAGDLESLTPEGVRDFHDNHDISWAQFLARMSGITVYNFSRGNMTAKEYWETFADEKGFWDKAKAAQAYIFALGCNDLEPEDSQVGSTGDISADFMENKPTFAGYVAKIIQRYKEIQPDAVFFLVTMPREPEPFVPKTLAARYEEHRTLMYRLAEFFTNTYVIDLAEYGPAYDEAFHRTFFNGGHLNIEGYYLVAKMIGSYIDFIVRSNFGKFNQAGFTGTPYRYCEEQAF
ncbi:MAG: SGNH/GDSL hydrolase family protein [Clostridia bacterium]|nr:SGNH/GDSL hydrolase family protein [Clostridia bacterium]MBP5780341.1 SGNH/GDSL hydrolase family protein [Clostridia bacterium]